jgi:hypothetical protein
MYQCGTKLRALSQALQEISGVQTVWLRRQTRRGATNLLLVGQVSGISFSRRIPDADPHRPERAIAKSLLLLKQIQSESANGRFSKLLDKSLTHLLHRARSEVLVLERNELIRSATAQSRLRWLHRAIQFLDDRNWSCEQHTLQEWILQTHRGSRERRERITASRALARVSGFEFEVKPEARFSSRHAPLIATHSVNEQAMLLALQELARRDREAGWVLAVCYSTGIRLRGVLSVNPEDLKKKIVIGSVIRYWDGKVGRQRQSEAIVSVNVDWLALGSVPESLWLAPWYRSANAQEHNQLELQASRIVNRVATVLGEQNKWVAARYLRRVATRRLLLAGVHPLQVCAAIGTSLPVLEKRYSDLFSSEAALAIRATLACQEKPIID